MLCWITLIRHLIFHEGMKMRDRSQKITLIAIFTLSCKNGEPYFPPNPPSADFFCAIAERNSADICTEDPSRCGEVACFYSSIPVDSEASQFSDGEGCLIPDFVVLAEPNVALERMSLACAEAEGRESFNHFCSESAMVEPWVLSFSCSPVDVDD